MRLLGLSLVFVAAVAHAEIEPLPYPPDTYLSGPAANDAAGAWAFAAMGAYYKDGTAPPTEALLQALAGGDAAAGQKLAALVVQVRFDEASGRAPWMASPFWGDSGQSSAKRVIDQLVALVKVEPPRGDVALPLAQALLEDLRGDVQLAGLSILEQTNTAAAREMVKVLYLNPRRALAVVNGAVALANKRKLAGAPKAFAWTIDLIAADLERAAARVYPPIDARTGRWLKVETGKAKRTLYGWLLNESASEVRVLTWHASVETLPRTDTTLTPMRLVDAATILRDARKLERDAAAEVLSSAGMLTGQFENGQLALPEILVAAWLLQAGDAKAAEALILPRVRELPDLRALDALALEGVARPIHERMLVAWTHRRADAEVITLAQHLSGPAFERYGYQARTRELLSQLERRKRDDEALPTPEQWAALKAKLSRGDQALYLVRRLRAITAIQWGQPGGVSYEEPQWVEGFVPGPQKTRLINPMVELMAMKLEPAEVAPLVPWLGDAAYMRMYSYWRDFHPARDLHRAADALAWVINEALQTPVVDLRGFERKTAAERAEVIARVAQWIKERAGRSGRELLRERVRAAKTIDQFGEAISRAGADNDPETITLILEREPDFASARARLAHYAFLTGDRRALSRAEQWLADPTMATDGRVMAGLIVLQHRPAAAIITALTPMMSAVDMRLRTFVIDRIERAGLAKTPEARALTCMAGPAINDHDVGLALLHRQVRAGCPDAGAALAQAIASDEVYGYTSGERNGQPVEVTQTWGDHHAAVINAWRNKPSDFDVLMPDAERARHRAEIKAWILAEAAAVRGGAKPTVPAAQPLMMLPWNETK